MIQKHLAEADKTVDFFRRKEEHLVRQSAAFTQQATVPKRALKASFLALYHIVHVKKPHTIGEGLLLPATKDIVWELLGEDAAKKKKKKNDTVPLSDNTVSRRFGEMA